VILQLKCRLAYIVNYEADINSALQSLRQREFQSGRYFPAIGYEFFPLTSDSPIPSLKHDSIEEAIEEADADGTQSILDIKEVSMSRSSGVASPLEPLEILHIFDTETPSIDLVNEEDIPETIFDFIDRGQAVYTILYENGCPSKLLFVGYSYD
jgi:hypothetical protein